MRTCRNLLEDGQVLGHPLVIGELACGGLAEHGTVLSLLERLPSAPEATHAEALGFIERHRLMSRGIGYIDVHLLAATSLVEDARLWTVDARLAAAASRLFISHEPGR